MCHLQDEMSASTAIQLKFILYCIVEIVEIAEIIDIGEYKVKEPSGITFKVSLGVAIAVATLLDFPKVSGHRKYCSLCLVGVSSVKVIEVNRNRVQGIARRQYCS